MEISHLLFAKLTFINIYLSHRKNNNMKKSLGNEIIEAFKAFNKGMECRGMKYGVGKEFECNGKPVLCNTGLHFCENPLGVFNYYPPENGKESIAVALGVNSKAKGALGCWIVLTEWEQQKDYSYTIKEVKTAKIDGVIIKADTFYILYGGSLMESN